MTDAFVSAAAVRAGYRLLERVRPDLRRGTLVPTARGADDDDEDMGAALERAFPLPEAIREAINRQLAVVLGGI